MRIPVFVASICVLSLSACSTLTRYSETQSNVTKFDRGAHAVAASEMAFLHRVQNAECTDAYYKRAYAYATDTRDKPFDLAFQCHPTELTNDQLQIRLTLLSAITLYADSLTALTNGSNETQFDSNSSDVAKNLEALAAQEKFSAIGTNAIAGVNAAVSSIAKFIIERREEPNIVDASARLQEPLETIVAVLKAENTDDGQGLKSKETALTNDFALAVRVAHEQQGPASLLDIYQAHEALDRLVVQPQDVGQLNVALDALVSANSALANPKSAEASSAISILVREGRAAVTLFKASK